MYPFLDLLIESGIMRSAIFSNKVIIASKIKKV